MSRAAEAKAVATLLCENRGYHLFEGENLVGRSADATVVIVDASVSRRHASIFIKDDEIWLEDLASTNGTFLNGRALTRPGRLVAESLVDFGGVRARFVLGAVMPSPGDRVLSSDASLAPSNRTVQIVRKS